MLYISKYDSPLGVLTIITDEEFLYELSFDDKELNYQNGNNLDIVIKVKELLDDYFAVNNPDFSVLKLKFSASQFRERVWGELLNIPYGKTVSYKDVALALGMKAGASRSIGQAVGDNPIAIIVPCHRVIGANGKLVGYDGGLYRKEYLLNLEADK